MAECPVCGSRLYTRNKGIPLINFRRIFGCDACGWKMDVAEVHRRGGLDRISIDTAREGKRHHESSSEWEEIDKLPNWAFRKMKQKKTNRVNGEHYTYKREGNRFYKKLK